MFYFKIDRSLTVKQVRELKIFVGEKTNFWPYDAISAILNSNPTGSTADIMMNESCMSVYT